MRPRGRWSVVALVAVALLVASTVPVPDGSPIGGMGPDGLFHALGYGVLAASTAAALAETPGVSTPRVGVLAIAGTIAYGAAIEALQGLLATRALSFRDLTANAIGALVGDGIWWLVTHGDPDDGP